jgi:hypothetical protein
MPEFEQILTDALPEFNRIRVPEVEATVKEITEDGFTVFFSGSFCNTCGYYDYFEDARAGLCEVQGFFFNRLSFKLRPSISKS